MSYGQNAPQGFVAVSNNLGVTWTQGVRQFQLNPAVAAANGGTIFSNDLVVADATGYPLQANTATASQLIVGCFQSCQYQVPTLAGPNGPFTPSPYFPGAGITLQAGTLPVGFILTDPNTIYNVQADVTLANGFIFADIFANANLIITGGRGGGSTLTGLSAMTLGAANQTNTSNMKIYGFPPSNIVGLVNQPNIQFNNVLTLINTPWMAYNTTGV